MNNFHETPNMNKIAKLYNLLNLKVNVITNMYNSFRYTSSVFEWDVREEIRIIGLDNLNLLAENMVYDPKTQKYYMIFSNYANGSIGILEADKLGLDWEMRATIERNGKAPHLLQYDGLWYLFFSHTGENSISVRTSENITYGYGPAQVVLSPSEDWECKRVLEPFVLRIADKWVMLYMGDSGNFTEQIGYAESDDLLNWKKSPRNPVIGFGKTYDRGTVADPWVYYEHGIYFVGYACGVHSHRPWRTALAITTCFTYFRKLGVILNLGRRNSCAFQGALTRFGDTYYFPYTGRSKGTYRICMAIKKDK